MRERASAYEELLLDPSAVVVAGKAAGRRDESRLRPAVGGHRLVIAERLPSRSGVVRDQAPTCEVGIACRCQVNADPLVPIES